MIRSTVARVDLAALKANFTAIRSYLSGESGRTAPAIIGVVKANAYGHGAPRVALALEEAGATMLACADIEEGIVLRQAGVRRYRGGHRAASRRRAGADSRLRGVERQ